MDIECPACKELIQNVADGAAGKRGKCPHCQTVIKIPLQGIVRQPPVAPGPVVAKSAAPPAPQPLDEWDLIEPIEDDFLSDPEEELIVERLPKKKKKRKGEEPVRPEHTRYSTLKLYMQCIRILAYATIGLSLIVFVFGGLIPVLRDPNADTFMLLLSAGLQLLVAMFAAMIILGGVEFMQLFVDMEKHQRRTVELLENRQ